MFKPTNTVDRKATEGESIRIAYAHISAFPIIQTIHEEIFLRAFKKYPTNNVSVATHPISSMSIIPVFGFLMNRTYSFLIRILYSAD